MALVRSNVAFACATIACAAGACRPARSLTAATPAVDPVIFHAAVIPVEIQNDNMQDLSIFVLHNGTKTKIGIAGAAQATTFTFPARLSQGAATVQLAAVPLIGGRFGWRKSIVSEAISVHQGERVVFNLESDLARSTIAVYAMMITEPADTVRPPADSSIGDSERASAADRPTRHR